MGVLGEAQSVFARRGPFDRRWYDVVASRTSADEAVAAEAVAQLAREHHITFELTAWSAHSGVPIPPSQVERHLTTRMLLVVVARQARQRRLLAWEPRDPKNVLLLLRS
jgi:hypothetical protein